MGDVYRAHDRRLGRDVAIKLLPAHFASDRGRLARFEQEARAASALNHPSIVTIHEIGEWRGLPYIVMELVQGRTLREVIAGRPFLSRRAIDMATQAAEGLATAHAAGIVHRDLKPENLMVRDDGFVKILDFGLAKLTGSGVGLPEALSEERTAATEEAVTADRPKPGSPETGAGAVIGTAGYMSPEQALGRQVDFRADQFAFGAILYEMATGKRAFQRDSPVQTLAAVIEQQPEPLQDANPAVPAPFLRIVERCLAKDPRERYASTHDLALDLRSARDHFEEASGGSGGAGPRPAPTPARATGRRVAMVAVLLVALAAGWGPLRRALRPPLPEQKQLAVLPFNSAGDDAEGRAFAEGLVETLTSKLTQLERFHGSLWVVPASEVRAAAVTSAAAARRSFGASLVVTGSVQRAGDLVRLTANLVDAGSLRQLRAVTVDARRDELTLLQDGLTERVAAMLELEVSDEARRVLGAGTTSIAGAWELYVQGRGHLASYENLASVEKAIAAFQQALQRDPGYALAYAGLGEAHWRRYELTKDTASVELARKACDRALALNDLLAPVHVTLGILRTGTGAAEQAVADFERALALDPASGDAYRGLGRAFEEAGRTADAERTYRKAIELRPDSWTNHTQLGVLTWRQGRYAEAEAAFRRAIELAPDNARAHSNLGALLHVVGRDDEATAELERAMAIRPSYAAASNLATIQFYRGRYAEAARAFEAARDIDARDYRLWRNLGGAYYWAPSERDKATDAFRRAVELGEEARSVNPRDADVLVRLADCYAMIGEEPSARRLVRDALATAPDDVEVLQVAAGVHEQLGQRDEALRLVKRALERGYPAASLERDPTFAALVRDPRYAARSGARHLERR